MKKPRAPRNQKSATAAARPPQILLFDLSKDVGEQNNVAEENPQIVSQLRARLEELDAEITTSARSLDQGMSGFDFEVLGKVSVLGATESRRLRVNQCRPRWQLQPTASQYSLSWLMPPSRCQ